MPRAEEPASDDQVNPARRSRFSVAWLFGGSGSGDGADHDLNDSLLNPGQDVSSSAPLWLQTIRHRATQYCCGCPCISGGGKRKPLACSCCVALAVSIGVWLLLLYQAYGDLLASLPDLAIHPVHVTGLCDAEFVAQGLVTMDNRAHWGVTVAVQTSTISLPKGPVAFSMRSDDVMAFAGATVTAQKATQLMAIGDQAAAGKFMQQFAVHGTIDAYVDVAMVVGISLLPGTYAYPYKALRTFSSLPIGAEAAIPGCLNGSTVLGKSLNKITIWQNDATAARTEVDATMSWYKAWTMTVDFPPTEWRLRNTLTREPIAYMGVPASSLENNAATASVRMNASIPKEFAVAAGDAFRRTMYLEKLSMEMVGTGQAGSIPGKCTKFAQLLQHFVYPVYVWDAAANATYNKDPYAPVRNPCKPAQVERRMEVLVDVTGVDLVRSNGTHAWMKLTLFANVSAGVPSVVRF